MTYSEAIEIIHKTPWKSHQPTLERITKLMSLLGNPQNRLRCIHIAGSNGKGSVAAMTASVLQSAGYRVGLCTSPYIHRFNERMKINGVPISDEELAELTEKVFAAAEKMSDIPTEFEFVNAITFEFFARHNCDIVVLEVGLGGRLDATNVINAPIAAVITAIGLEHTELLGDTAEKIAFEKAGIIKSGCSAVLGENSPEVRAVVEKVCRGKGVSLKVTSGKAFTAEKITAEYQLLRGSDNTEYKLPLLGAHQRQNLACVLAVTDILRENGFKLSREDIQKGIADTRWIGRFEKLSSSPDFFVDGGHNPQCAGTIAQTFKDIYGGKKAVLLIGLLADKDIDGILKPILPLTKAVFTITPPSPRAMESRELSLLLAKRYKIESESFDSIEKGITAALKFAEPDDVIVAFGSLYSVGAIREYFNKFE